MKKRRILRVMLSLGAALTLAVTAAAAGQIRSGGQAEASAVLLDNSGIHNDAVRWTLDADGVLTLYPYYPPDASEEDMEEPKSFDGDSRSDYDWSPIADEVKKIVIEDGISNVGAYAFQNYENLKAAELGKDVEEIESNAFDGCAALEIIQMSESLNEIGEQAFQGCTGLTSLAIGPQLESIREMAFQGCEKLETLSLSGALDALEDNLFDGCTALKEVTLEGTADMPLDSPNGTPFRNCASLETLTISGPADELQEDMFAFVDEDGNTVNRDGKFEYNNPEPVASNLKSADLSGLAPPEDGEEFPPLPDRFFMGCVTLRSVQLPDNMTEVGEQAFYGCTALESVNIPSGLTEIMAQTFYGCESLKAASIPAAVINVQEGAFQNCKSLSDLAFANKGIDQDMQIGPSAFRNCRALETVILPKGLETIGASAFQDCVSLSSVEFPKDLYEIEENAFRNCSSLGSLYIPSTSQFELGKSAFEDCTRLETVDLQMDSTVDFVLPEGLFRNCTSLSVITLPIGVTEVGEYAFENCAALVSIALPNRCTEILPYAFLQCSSLRSFEIHAQGVTIEHNAFSNCSGMTRAVIPEGVSSIGPNAFERCLSIEKAVIPTDAEEVSGRAFAYCSNLTDIYYADRRENWTSKSFGQEGSDLMNWINANGVTIHYEWDSRNDKIDPMDGDPVETGGGDSGDQDRPVNPDDPANLYGDGLPAKITAVKVTASGVSAKVLGDAEQIEGGVLFAASYGSAGIIAMGSGTLNDGVCSINLDNAGAIYVQLFFLKDSLPIAERVRKLVE